MPYESGGTKTSENITVVKPLPLPFIRQDSTKSQNESQGGSFSLKMFWESEGLESQTSGSRKLGDEKSSMKGLFKMGTAMFLDATEMKEKVRESLAQPTYNVTEYYHETGCVQQWARSALFEKVTLFVTFVNSIWIWVDTDLNKAEVLYKAPLGFQVAEHLFTAFFTTELVIRFCAFKRKRDGLKDKWLVFDLVLVSFMVMETWVLSFILLLMSASAGAGWLSNTSILRVGRLLRLSRMARMAKLLKAMPELMILIKGMMAAMRSVFFTLCLLCIIMYVFAIAFTQLTPGYRMYEEHFSTVLLSMYTLLVRGALLDNVSILLGDIKKQSMALAVVFLIFVLISALTVLNMLIGVLVHVVSSVAAVEREEQQLAFVKVKMENLVREIDTDGDSEISRNEFANLITNVEAIKCLLEIGVDPVGLVDQCDFIFTDPVSGEDRDDLSFSEFMEVVLELRGRNNATVKDIIDMRKFMLMMFERMENKLERKLARSLTWNRLPVDKQGSRNSSKSALRGRKSTGSDDGVSRNASMNSMKSEVSHKSSMNSQKSVGIKEDEDVSGFKLGETKESRSPDLCELRASADSWTPSQSDVTGFIKKLEEALDTNLKELERILSLLDINGSREERVDGMLHRHLTHPAEHQLTSRVSGLGPARIGASLGLQARAKVREDSPGRCPEWPSDDELGCLRCSRLLGSLSSELQELHDIRHDLPEPEPVYASYRPQSEASELIIQSSEVQFASETSAMSLKTAQKSETSSCNATDV